MVSPSASRSFGDPEVVVLFAHGRSKCKQEADKNNLTEH